MRADKPTAYRGAVQVTLRNQILKVRSVVHHALKNKNTVDVTAIHISDTGDDQGLLIKSSGFQFLG